MHALADNKDTVRVVQLSLRKIGNSQGFLVPKTASDQLGLHIDGLRSAILEIKRDGTASLFAKPEGKRSRAGWAAAANKLAEAPGGDENLMGDFANHDDQGLVW